MVALLVFYTHGMVLVLWGVGAILGNGYRIQWQNYVEIFREVKCKQGFATGIWY